MQFSMELIMKKENLVFPFHEHNNYFRITKFQLLVDMFQYNTKGRNAINEMLTHFFVSKQGIIN